MKKFFTFALAAVAALTVSAQQEQLKTGDHFEYNGNGYTPGEFKPGACVFKMDPPAATPAD